MSVYRAGVGASRELAVCGKKEYYPRLRSWAAQHKWQVTLLDEATLVMERL